MEDRTSILLNSIIGTAIFIDVMFIKIVAIVIVGYYVLNDGGKIIYSWRRKQRIINNHKQKQNELVQEKSNSDKD